MKKITFFIAMVLLCTSAFSQGIEFNQIINWTGSGDSTAMFIIDFNDSETNECYAFGYRFEGTKTAEDMLNDINASNTSLSIVIGSGFLSDITYGTQSGIGGSPYYWSNLIYTNNNWVPNMDGIAQALSDSIIFGCSYTDWQLVDNNYIPINNPENPIPAEVELGIAQNNSDIKIKFYYNNSLNKIRFNSENDCNVILSDISGRVVSKKDAIKGENSIEVSFLKSGVYFVSVYENNFVYTEKFMKN